MKKLRLYLDTSVISHLDSKDTPEKMSDTQKLWQNIIDGKFEIIVSNVTIEELERCKEPKRNLLLNFIKEIKFDLVTENEDVKDLAEKYIENEILKQKSYDDCLHIACAVIFNCDLIISWNFKHLVNYKTIKGVKIVNSLNDYREIGIISPTMLIEEE